MKKQNGIFITLEGVEGSGKSSLVPLLVDALKHDFKKDIYLTREPGGTELSEDIRNLLFQYHDSMNQRTELLLFLAARSELSTIIQDEMDKGNIVLADRFMDSTFVYQGMLNNLGINLVQKMNNFATKDLEPTHTFVLLISYEESVSRLAGRSDNGKYDELDRDGFYQIYHGYEKLAEMFPNRIHIIDGAQTQSEILKEILNIISSEHA